MVTLKANTYERHLARPVRDPVADCILRKGIMFKKGYGSLSINDRLRRVHRVVYELFPGQVEDGLVLDHLCRNHACLNANHLDPVTLVENNL